MARLGQNRTAENEAHDQWYRSTNDAIRDILGTPEFRTMPATGPVVVVRADTGADQRVRVEAHNSYEIREQLKARGYRFDGIDRAWYRLFGTVGEAVEEARDLGIETIEAR